MQRQYIAAPGLRPILVTDTITILVPEDEGAVVVSGSHGGVSSAQFVLGRSLAGVLFNDAGIGKDDAGIAGLGILDEVGLPTAAVDHRSAMVGLGTDTWHAGIISHVNRSAARAGLEPGQSVAMAAALLSHGIVVSTSGKPSTLNRQACLVGSVEVVLIDSVSMLRANDRNAIVVSGSHGGSVSAEFASRHRPKLTVFNDAGLGKNDAGCGVLASLSASGLAAATVDCHSGRIGDPADMLASGIISRSNPQAAEFGFLPGRGLAEAIAACADRRHSPSSR